MIGTFSWITSFYPLSINYAYLLLLVLPSAPRNVTVTFVNQSAVEIRWLPPVMPGDQTRVYYDVSCHKACVSNETCLDGDCERNVSYVPNKGGLNVTQVMISDLSPLDYYSFKIYAKNRVSEVAKRRHSVEGSFIAIVVRTNGSSELLMEFVRNIHIRNQLREIRFPYCTYSAGLEIFVPRPLLKLL